MTQQSIATKVTNPSSNIYDVFQAVKPTVYSHYADPRNISKESGWHYIEREEAGVVMEALAQDLGVVETQSYHNGYDVIPQLIATNAL